jgi:hypothetical protein
MMRPNGALLAVISPKVISCAPRAACLRKTSRF